MKLRTLLLCLLPLTLAATEPPALLTSPGPEFSHAQRRWQGIPSIEVTRGGRLWATWYGGLKSEGEPGNYQLLVTSGDDGHTWSDPMAVYQAQPVDKAGTGDGHVWIDPPGRLWFIVNRAVPGDEPYGPRTTWGFLAADPENAAPAWSAPVFLGPGLVLNKPLVLSTGEWLNPIDHPAASAKKAEPPTRRPRVYVSTDAGASWAFRGAVDVPEVTFAEHMLIERRDASLWMLVRTSYGLAQSESHDRGQTWSTGHPFTDRMSVNTRFHLRRLKSGALLLVVNDDKARRRLTALLSDDDGATWPHRLLLDERDTSYPDAAQAADGSIYVIYDQRRYQRGAQQILFAKITEADIRAGAVVQPESRLAQKINRLSDYGGGVDDAWEAEAKIRNAAKKAKDAERAAKEAAPAGTSPQNP